MVKIKDKGIISGSIQHQKIVWVVEDGRATRRQINISGYSGPGVVVGEGLKRGDIVIVEGYQKVSEGMKVECGIRNAELGMQN